MPLVLRVAAGSARRQCLIDQGPSYNFTTTFPELLKTANRAYLYNECVVDNLAYLKVLFYLRWLPIISKNAVFGLLHSHNLTNHHF